MHVRHGLLLGAGLAGGIVSMACAGSVDTAECVDDSDCAHIRGGFCDTVAAACDSTTTEHDATKTNPDVTFVGEEMTFFRGLVCTAKNGAVKTGTQIPMNVFPCLHPCLTIEEAHPLRVQTKCANTTCETFAYRGYRVSGNNCPDDVFGQFDQSQCVYSGGIGTSVSPMEIEGEYRESFIFVEIPYLTNDDAAYIASLPDNQQNAAVKTTAYEYPLDESRRFMLEVRDEFAESTCGILNADPDEPTAGTAQDPDCTCFEVGFHE